MVEVFFDTSAVVRRYHPTEPGSATVRALCSRRSGNGLLLAEITSVEVASALNRKVREGTLDARQRDRQWRLFRAHGRTQYRWIALDASVYRRAERLLFRYRLRANDALQIAGALRARQLLTPSSTDFRFCTADREQASAAHAEGLRVELIA